METNIINAIVTNTKIDCGDHNILSIWLFLDYGGSVQGFGGYNMYDLDQIETDDIKSYAGHFIVKCLQVCDVTDWSQITNKTVRVELRDGLIHGIGHIVKDIWFYPRKDFSISVQPEKNQE